MLARPQYITASNGCCLERPDLIGLDRNCQPSFRNGLGEIVFWGDPSEIHSLPTHLISEALARGGKVSSRIKVGGGATRVFTSVRKKDPDLKWEQVADGSSTSMESVWGNETIREFNVEADLHALNGHHFVGALVRFDSKKGDAAALAALDKLLNQQPPPTEEALLQHLSVLFVANRAGGNKKYVWRMGA